ncbi:MAG: ComEC family competence protein [Candidatus Omnitrophica bacterium]|nr:ComEC family competence protein [Candidatus Omnitrophota bacterium]
MSLNRINFLPLFTICFCLGIFLAKYIHIRFLYLYILSWGLLILSFILAGHKNSVWLILILAVFLGGMFLLNTYILPYPHIRNFSFYKSEPVVLKGIVNSFPQAGLNRSSFILSAEELSWAGKIYPVCGRVLVKVFRREKASYAERVVLRGNLFRPYQPKNSGFQYRDYLENQGIYSILSVSSNKPIEYLGVQRAYSIVHSIYKIRQKCSDFLFANLKAPQAAILSAMILGERSKIPAQLRRLFIQTGTVHILAISGLHVGIIAFILELLLKALGLKRRLRYVVIIALLGVYCFLTGARPSVIRATLMAIILLTGFLLKREIQIYYSLSLVALAILIFSPRQLFNLGFQLSFISVLSIIYLSPMIKNFLIFKFNADNHKNILFKFFTSAFSVSLAAWLATAPLVLYYFRIISPVAVLANLVIVPYLSLVIVLGLILIFFGLSFPFLSAVFSGPANLSLIVLVEIIKLFSQIPGAYVCL